MSKSSEGLGILSKYLSPTSLICLDAQRRIFVKKESENPTRSFKDRPAIYGVRIHQKTILERGLLAASSGNFAQAIAHAAQQIGVRARIVMTSTTSDFKVKRTKGFGGEVIFAGETFESRELKTAEILEHDQPVFLHPFDCEETIVGDGSLALELHQQIQGPLDIFVPASGGGLLAATATIYSELDSSVRVFGAQPVNNGSLEKSFRQGRREKVAPFKTICDSLIAQIPGANTFPLIQKYVEDVFSLSENEVLQSLVDLWGQYQIFTEPGCACAWAAAKKSDSFDDPSRIKVIILTGANVEASQYKKWGIGDVE